MLDLVQRRKFVQISVIILVLLNIGLMASIFLNNQLSRQQAPGPQGLEFFLEKELSLTPKQVEQMHAIRNQHFQSTRPLVQALKDSSELLIQQAFLEDGDSTRAAVIAQHIGNIHNRLDLELYEHFVQLSLMCTPDQKIRLRELAHELTGGKAPRHPGQRPPPGKRPDFGNRPPPPDSDHSRGGGPPPRDR